MKEYRCKKCHKLLFKYTPNAIFELEITCPKCKERQVLGNYNLNVKGWKRYAGSVV